ncbi:MAG: EAL domain-containing protein [Leptolyngbyaceae cyanobacterium bins.302]|nr:EAL domain-containing protein [Leptolyngbyaceae cyanobacterium bins.302]
MTDSTPILSASEIKNFQLENDLIVAFEQHSFQLFYQPIIAIESNEMIGFEVILKWLNSQDEWIDPPVFLPLAQRLGLIEELTQWQIEQACQQLRVWQQQYPIHTGLTININLSIAQFLQPNFIPTLKGILQATGISPANLSLSIAEISFIQNHESMFSVIASLKALGIQCCMADFSISYFTLNILKDLSIDTLKVKCSLLTNKTWKVSKAILAIAKKLGLTTIVEEVESLEKVSFLKTLGCNQAQGHFFSEPVDAETARVFLSTFSLRH